MATSAAGTKIFILSPASTGGKRAGLLLADRAAFDLALRVREGRGAALGEVFSFLSGLYFRAKLGYARAFGNPPAGLLCCYVITSNSGLVSPDRMITAADLRRYARTPIDMRVSGYSTPLRRDAAALGRKLPEETEVIFLGSLAARKYLPLLLEELRRPLLVPESFAGIGDMSRGALMLRATAAGRELAYRVLREPALQNQRGCR